MTPRPLLPGLLAVFAALIVVSAARAGTSLRFHGFGQDQLDRVKIRIDDPANSNDEPGPPVDVGATDFTIEFFVKGLLAENGAGAVACGAGEQWIYGNIVLDRDRWEPGGRDFGVSFGAGRVAFGVTNASFDSRTVCGLVVVLDGDWHHVAVQRRLDGLVRIWVDGALDASDAGPFGDVSYPGDATPTGTNCGGGPCFDSDPFLVIGAEKHDAGASFPSFSGWVDEIRVSSGLRYLAPFSPPTAPFAPDAQTLALYHFDEGIGNAILDSSGAVGGPSPGERRFGGSPVPGPEWSLDTPFAGATEGVARPSLAAGAILEAHPNPALGEVILFARFPDGREGPLAISIHDVAGRKVAELASELRGGATLVVWDGKAASGEGAARGVYFASVPPAGLSAKFTLR